MDQTFWAGIILGAIVSLVVSIVANLYTPQIRAFLDKRVQLRLSNKKAEELKEYELAKGIFSGAPLAIQKLERRRESGLRMMLFSVQFLVMVVALISIRIAVRPDDAMLGHLAFILMVVVTVASAAALMTSVSITRNVRDLIQKASNLEEYEKDIRKKWGEDAI